ncbi:MAG: hypothetical protein AAGL08_17480 [Cyanobacteria bacterium J06573_11]
MPHKAAIFLNLKLGLLLGLALSSFDVATFYAQKKLQISEASKLKSLVLPGVMSVGVAGAYVCLLTLFAPDYATRSELYNSSIEEIGFGFAIALMLIGLFIVSLPAKAILANLERSKTVAKDQ